MDARLAEDADIPDNRMPGTFACPHSPTHALPPLHEGTHRAWLWWPSRMPGSIRAGTTRAPSVGARADVQATVARSWEMVCRGELNYRRIHNRTRLSSPSGRLQSRRPPRTAARAPWAGPCKRHFHNKSGCLPHCAHTSPISIWEVHMLSRPTPAANSTRILTDPAPVTKGVVSLTHSALGMDVTRGNRSKPAPFRRRPALHWHVVVCTRATWWWSAE